MKLRFRSEARISYLWELDKKNTADYGSFRCSIHDLNHLKVRLSSQWTILSVAIFISKKKCLGNSPDYRVKFFHTGSCQVSQFSKCEEPHRFKKFVIQFSKFWTSKPDFFDLIKWRKRVLKLICWVKSYKTNEMLMRKLVWVEKQRRWFNFAYKVN